MTVVDRYLMAVRVFLPRSAQRDIVAELSDDIHSRIEDQEGTLGRPLTAAEQEAIVADFGHPALLAGRYGPRRRLIGPEIFPFYWLVLRLALVVGVAVHVAVTMIMLAQGRADQAIRQATQVLPVVAFIQFGVITLIFALLDNYGVLARVGHCWNPRTLPTAGRVQPFLQLALVAIFAAWWFSALRAAVSRLWSGRHGRDVRPHLAFALPADARPRARGRRLADRAAPASPVGALSIDRSNHPVRPGPRRPRRSGKGGTVGGDGGRWSSAVRPTADHRFAQPLPVLELSVCRGRPDCDRRAGVSRSPARHSSAA